MLRLIVTVCWCISVVHGQRRDPLMPFLTSGSCGVDKQCIQLPSADCNFDTCDVLLTWRTGTLRGQNVVVYELTGAMPSVTQSQSSVSGYLAVFFSGDQERGNDYIMACGWDGASEFTRNAYLRADSRFLDSNPVYVLTGSPEVYYNSATNRIACTFAILRDSNPGVPLRKLSNGIALTYYFATGTDPQLGDLPILSHNAGTRYGPFYMSPDEIPLTNEAWHSIPKKSPSVAHRAHGILMLISWMWFASIAIVTARYMKTALGNVRSDAAARASKSKNEDQAWFQIHRALHIAAVVLTIISFVLIFIVEAKWIGSDFPFLPEAAHPVLGCIVMALALINFVLGWCAPRSLTRERCVWNWFHWFIGSATHCLAIPTMFIGMSMKSWAWYAPVILFVWVIFHVVVELLLEILACCALCTCCFNRSKQNDGVIAASKENKNKDQTGKESQALVFHNADGSRVVMHDDQTCCRCGVTCRMVIWAVHIAVTSILAITLCFVLALTG